MAFVFSNSNKGGIDPDVRRRLFQQHIVNQAKPGDNQVIQVDRSPPQQEFACSEESRRVNLGLL
jgi:hypothetical protein